MSAWPGLAWTCLLPAIPAHVHRTLTVHYIAGVIHCLILALLEVHSATNLPPCFPTTLADGALGFLTALSTLQHLDLSGCKELSPAGLAPLSALSCLESLKLQHCTGLRGPSALSALSPLGRLSALNLGGCTGIYGQALRALRCALGMLRCAVCAAQACKFHRCLSCQSVGPFQAAHAMHYFCPTRAAL